MRLTDEVVDSVSHHVGGLGGAVEAEVLGHGLFLLGGLTHLLQKNSNLKLNSSRHAEGLTV